MKLKIRQLLRILWWGFFNKNKAKIFFNALDSGMADCFAYERANKGDKQGIKKN